MFTAQMLVLFTAHGGFTPRELAINRTVRPIQFELRAVRFELR